MSSDPLVTVVITTRDRPVLVRRALTSALAQTEPSVEVVVVDDGSSPPLELDEDPRVRIVRHVTSRGVAAARNSGLDVARGRWVTFLDDDDRLLPGMVERALRALATSTLPEPRAALCAIAVVDGNRLVGHRVPPSLPRGSLFMLEPIPPGQTHETKRTLLAPRETLAALGGFDATLRFREQSDLMLRLNAACSVVGVPEAGYLLTRDGGPRMSRDARLLDVGFRQFEAKHRGVLAARRAAYADVLLGHARMVLVAGPRRAFLPTVLRALRVAPAHAARALLDPRRAVSVVRESNASA